MVKSGVQFQVGQKVQISSRGWSHILPGVVEIVEIVPRAAEVKDIWNWYPKFADWAHVYDLEGQWVGYRYEAVDLDRRMKPEELGVAELSEVHYMPLEVLEEIADRPW